MVGIWIQYMEECMAVALPPMPSGMILYGKILALCILMIFISIANEGVIFGSYTLLIKLLTIL